MSGTPSLDPSLDPSSLDPSLAEAVADLPVAPEGLLRERALLKRVDTKFLAPLEAVPPLLAIVAEQYATIPGAELVPQYNTLYFDTPGLDFYEAHRRGRRPRQKVRVRHYPARNLSFLEVKTKTSQERTEKERRSIAVGQNELTEADRAFLHELVGSAAKELQPQLWTNFRRTTLLGLNWPERVTIDEQLRFAHYTGDQVGAYAESPIGRVAVIELKQERFSPRSPLFLALRSAGIRSWSFSKYCSGAAILLNPQRVSPFAPRLRRIERLANG